MPEKKPSARTSRTPSRTTSKSTAKPSSRAKPAPRARTAKPAEQQIEDDFSDEPRSARPVAVGATPSQAIPLEPEAGPLVEETAIGYASPGAVFEEPLGPPETGLVERPGIELLTGIAGLVMALGVFLPTWYKVARLSGWSSGNFAPLVALLGIAVAAIVSLRLAKVPVAFPLETSWILEGIGWLSIVLLFFTRVFVKVGGFGVATSGWLFAFVPAIAIALLGGYTSAHAPFVVRPGWFKSSAAKLGVGILAVALVGGVAGGVILGPSTPKQVLPKVGPREVGVPKCGKSFVLPAGITPVDGRNTDVPGQGSVCLMNLKSTLAPKAVGQRYDAALKSANAQHIIAQNSPTVVQIQVTSGSCAFISVAKATTGTGSTVTVQSFDCKLIHRGQ
ncbi:MAG: hypothetical protein ABR552_00140 [Actinomycetota bacterium]